jgi:hypothetical protein
VSLPWWVLAIVLGREAAMTWFRHLAQRRGVVIAAIGPGKAKATFQYIWVGAAYFWFAYRTWIEEHGFTAPVGVLSGVFLADEVDEALPGAVEMEVPGAPAALVRPDDVVDALARAGHGQLARVLAEARPRHAEIHPRRFSSRQERRDVLSVRIAVNFSVFVPSSARRRAIAPDRSPPIGITNR